MSMGPPPAKEVEIPGRGRIELTDFSQSYGGTLYGTTPGGTKIQYGRDLMMGMRNSPFSSSPPSNLPLIPGVTKGAPAPPAEEDEEIEPEVETKPAAEPPAAGAEAEDDMFQMDD